MGGVLARAPQRYGAYAVDGGSSGAYSEHAFSYVLAEHAITKEGIGKRKVIAQNLNNFRAVGDAYLSSTETRGSGQLKVHQLKI